MRRVSRYAFAAWFALSAGGCASIAGLDSLQEQDCAPFCDGGGSADVTIDVPPEQGGDDTSTADTFVAHDTSTMDTYVAPDTSPPGDDASMEAEAEAGPEGGKEGGVDAPPDVDWDAPFDSGCGPLNSVNNCSACGKACLPVSATNPVCTGPSNGMGATCSYTCSTGYLDCNAGTAPNTDGCECHAPGATAMQCCAGGACPQKHDWDLNLINTTFYDCVPSATLNVSVAGDACAAYAGGANQCDQVYSQYYCTYPDGGLAGDMVCSDGPGAPACTCWGYDGDIKGHMRIGPGKGTNNCQCPAPTDPTWD